MINAFAIVSLISFIVCIILGFFVYYKEVKYKFDNKLAKIFVLLCLSLGFFWAFIEFGYRSATDFYTAYLWSKVNVLWYFVVSFLVHFTLILTGKSKLVQNKLIYLLIYGPAIIFFLFDINTKMLLTEPIKQTWGWTYGIPKYPLVYNISTTWAAFSGIFCIYMCLDYYINLNNISKKKAMKYTIIGFLIPMGISLQTEWLFPIMKIQFPELLVPSLTIGLIIIWYTALKLSTSNNLRGYNEIKEEVDFLLKTSKINI